MAAVALIVTILTLLNTVMVGTMVLRLPKKPVEGPKELPAHVTRSPELCLFEHVVMTFEPEAATYPAGFKVKVPDKENQFKTHEVRMEIEKGRVLVKFADNEFIFPVEEQAEAKRIYDLAAAKSRAGALMLIAEHGGADVESDR